MTKKLLKWTIIGITLNNILPYICICLKTNRFVPNSVSHNLELNVFREMEPNLILEPDCRVFSS